MCVLYFGDDSAALVEAIKTLENQNYGYYYGDYSSLENLLTSTSLFKAELVEKFIVNIASNGNLLFDQKLLNLLKKTQGSGKELVFVVVGNIRITNEIKSIFSDIKSFKI